MVRVSCSVKGVGLGLGSGLELRLWIVLGTGLEFRGSIVLEKVENTAGMCCTYDEKETVAIHDCVFK